MVGIIMKQIITNGAETIVEVLYLTAAVIKTAATRPTNDGGHDGTFYNPSSVFAQGPQFIADNMDKPGQTGNLVG